MSVPCKLGQQNHSYRIFETNKESLPCSLAWSMAWSWGYSPPRKHIQYISQSKITFNICNILFRVTGTLTCTCIDFKGFHLAGPTLSCCSAQHQAGTKYDSSSIEVCSTCSLLKWLSFADMMQMDSAMVYQGVEQRLFSFVAPEKILQSNRGSVVSQWSGGWCIMIHREIVFRTNLVDFLLPNYFQFQVCWMVRSEIDCVDKLEYSHGWYVSASHGKNSSLSVLVLFMWSSNFLMLLLSWQLCA
jgi:hypothetical protein